VASKDGGWRKQGPQISAPLARGIAQRAHRCTPAAKKSSLHPWHTSGAPASMTQTGHRAASQWESGRRSDIV